MRWLSFATVQIILISGSFVSSIAGLVNLRRRAGRTKGKGSGVGREETRDMGEGIDQGGERGWGGEGMGQEVWAGGGSSARRRGEGSEGGEKGGEGVVHFPTMPGCSTRVKIPCLKKPYCM